MRLTEAQRRRVARLLALGALGFLVWPLPALLTHTSEYPRLLGRYSPRYLAILIGYSVFVALCAALVAWLFGWRPSRRLARAWSRIQVRRGLLVAGGFVVLSTEMLAFQLLLAQGPSGLLPTVRHVSPLSAYLLLLATLLLLAVDKAQAPPGEHISGQGRRIGSLARLLAPALVGIYATLFLYANNLTEVTFDNIVRSLIVVTAGSLLLAGLLSLVLRNTVHAVLLAWAVLLAFFSSGHLVMQVDGLEAFEVPEVAVVSLLLALIMGAATLILTIRRAASLRRINNTLSLVTGLLIVATLVQVALFPRARARALPPALELVPTDTSQPLPDIYYILLDAYSGNSTLLDEYGFDNREFTDALEQRGFYVAYESRFNYCSTFLAMPSLLNMQYLDFLAQDPGRESRDPTIPHLMTDDSVVWRSLEPLGYEYVHFRTHHGATRRNLFADYDLAIGDPLQPAPGVRLNLVGISEFETTLANSTALHRYVDDSLVGPERRATVSYIFETLEHIHEIEAPAFTFAHIASPHGPFVFDASEGPIRPGGTPVDGEIVGEAKYASRDEIIGQFIAVNRMTVHLVDQILAASDTPPIIVIQADHGLRPSIRDGVTFFASGLEHIKAYAPILSAFYVPDAVRENLYPSITPVNTFRVIFDGAFGTDLGLLDDRQICFLDRQTPYDFYDF